jgi:hypothetical protein
MMGWSHLSSNPCTVLVKEKQDRDSQHNSNNNQVDCSPSLQSSTNRPTDHHNQQQDHPQDSGALGNSIGGKKTRIKRKVYHESEHVDGHAEETIDEIIETIERRILVNITVGMDKGLGTIQQEVYQLQVAVPLKGKQKAEKNDFYAYKVNSNNEVFDKTTNDYEGSNEDISAAESTTLTEFEEFDNNTFSMGCDCNNCYNSRYFGNNIRGFDVFDFCVPRN